MAEYFRDDEHRDVLLVITHGDGTATVAAHPSATRPSPHTCRPTRNTSGTTSDASSELRNRTASTSPTSPAPKPRHTHNAGAIIQ